MLLRVTCTGDAGDINTTANTTTDYVRKGVVIQPSDFDTATSLMVRVYIAGAENQYAYFDTLMVNEISAADYAAGVDACLAKYPYKAP